MGKRLTDFFVSLGERAKGAEDEDAAADEKAASNKPKIREVRGEEDTVCDGVDEAEVMLVPSLSTHTHEYVPSLSTHAHEYTHAHARAHTQTHGHTHTHTHTHAQELPRGRQCRRSSAVFELRGTVRRRLCLHFSTVLCTLNVMGAYAMALTFEICLREPLTKGAVDGSAVDDEDLDPVGSPQDSEWGCGDGDDRDDQEDGKWSGDEVSESENARRLARYRQCCARSVATRKSKQRRAEQTAQSSSNSFGSE